MTIRDMVSSTISNSIFCCGDKFPRSMSSRSLSPMKPLDSRRSLTNVVCLGNSPKYHLTPKSRWCRFCRRKTGGRSLPLVSGTGRRLFEQAFFHSFFRNMDLLLSARESMLFLILMMPGWPTNMVSCSQADRTFFSRDGLVFGGCKAARLLS